jgi:hypothetical protein
MYNGQIPNPQSLFDKCLDQAGLPHEWEIPVDPTPLGSSVDLLADIPSLGLFIDSNTQPSLLLCPPSPLQTITFDCEGEFFVWLSTTDTHHQLLLGALPQSSRSTSFYRTRLRSVSPVSPINGRRVSPINGRSVSPINGIRVSPINGIFSRVSPLNGSPSLDVNEGSQAQDPLSPSSLTQKRKRKHPSQSARVPPAGPTVPYFYEVGTLSPLFAKQLGLLLITNHDQSMVALCATSTTLPQTRLQASHWKTPWGTSASDISPWLGGL